MTIPLHWLIKEIYSDKSEHTSLHLVWEKKRQNIFSVLRRTFLCTNSKVVFLSYEL